MHALNIMCNYDGNSVKMYGALLVTLADTLGAHQLGGFKVGVGFALRICCTCMTTKETIKNQVHIQLPNFEISYIK